MSTIRRLNSARSTTLYLVIAALLMTLVAGGVMAVSRHKTVTIDVDGDMISLSTMKTDVNSALVDAGYTPSHTKLALWTYVAETHEEAEAGASTTHARQ